MANASRRALTAVAVLLVAGVGIAGCTPPQEPVRLAAMGRERLDLPVARGVVVASAAGKYLAGNHAQRVRDYGTAADYLTDALTIDEGNRDLRRRAFLAMLTSGQMKEATNLARIIIERDPKLDLAIMSLAVEEARAGNFAAAEKQFEGIENRGINTVMMPLLLAWTQAGQGDTAAALDALSALVKNDRFQVVHDLHAGLINEVAGNTAAAEKAYVRARAKRLTLRLVQALGALYERTERTNEAKALYGEFLKNNPNTEVVLAAHARATAGKAADLPVNSARQGMAEVFYNMANTLTRGRSIEHALIYGHFALYMRPDYPVGQLLVGGILDALDRHEEAIRIYNRVKSASPLGWTARLRKVSSLAAMDKTEAAIAELTGMAEEKVKRHDALVALGDLLRGKKRYVAAIAAYSKALERVGKLEKRHWAILYSRGISYERADQWEAGERDLLHALKLNADQPYVLNYLGYSWIDKGVNLARARKMIEQAVKIRPNDGYIVDSLGWALYRMGEFETATRHLEQAILLRPEDPVINDHLGDAYWRVGRRLEAKFQWKRVLTLKPEAKQIPEVEKKIRNGLSGGELSSGDGPSSGGG